MLQRYNSLSLVMKISLGFAGVTAVLIAMGLTTNWKIRGCAKKLGEGGCDELS